MIQYCYSSFENVSSSTGGVVLGSLYVGILIFLLKYGIFTPFFSLSSNF